MQAKTVQEHIALLECISVYEEDRRLLRQGKYAQLMERWDPHYCGLCDFHNGKCEHCILEGYEEGYRTFRSNECCEILYFRCNRVCQLLRGRLQKMSGVSLLPELLLIQKLDITFSQMIAALRSFL